MNNYEKFKKGKEFTFGLYAKSNTKTFKLEDDLEVLNSKGRLYPCLLERGSDKDIWRPIGTVQQIIGSGKVICTSIVLGQEFEVILSIDEFIFVD